MTPELFLFLFLQWSLPPSNCLSHSTAAANQSRFFDFMRQFLAGPALHAWPTSGGAADDFCNYAGISCNRHRYVEAIDISAWSLSGRFPSDICSYLPALRILRLGGNNLRGTFPAGIVNCSFLEELDVSSCGLAGELPDFSGLSSLRVLDTSGNVFTGAFPASVFNLSRLEFLNFNENHGFEPWTLPEKLTKLSRLKVLILSSSSLRGEIPNWIGNMSSLEDLELCGNNLKGQIPPTIGKLVELHHLELYYNLLGGEIPPEIGNLTRLEDLDISVNQLTGSIPGKIMTLPHLQVVQFYSNRLTGELPVCSGNSTSLSIISLYQNFLTGELPATLGSSSKLMVIELSENRFSGRLPPEVCAGGVLQYFLVLDNLFSGELPENYGKCESLLRFRASYNRLGGHIPEGLLGLPHLFLLDLSFNRFQGRIPRTIGNGKNLSALFLQNNRISGSLPREISRATTLTKIDLSNNLLTGAVPEALGDMIQLNQLSLQGNNLVSSIPSSLSALKNLNVLNLSNNQLTGEIPESICSLLPCSIDFSNNQLSGPVPLPLLREGLDESFAGNPGLCAPTHSGYYNSALPPCGPSNALRNMNSIWFIGTSVVLCAIATIVLARRTVLTKGVMAKQDQGSSSSSLSYEIMNFHKVNFHQREIVDSLVEENIVGRGGSGTVYRIHLSDGEAVAVKKLRARKLMKAGTPLAGEIKTEVQTLGSIRHKNIVKLYCCFSSSDCNLLVYEYMPNGDLWNALHGGKNILDWKTRQRIAMGIAQGLAYLHHDLSPPVVHRDVKTSNVLLDAEFEPKLADFGVAKVLQAGGETDATATGVAGTYGYMAPEYAYASKVTTKGDVYSFGVVLMELVTGRKPRDAEFGEDANLVQWVSSMVATREGAEMVVDKKLLPLKEEMIGLLRIALRCARTALALRPSMNEVVQLLAEAAGGRGGRNPA